MRRTHSPPFQVGRRRLPFQASLATPVAMAPRRRPREGVAKQATRQEAGDAPPPQQTQPLPQDAHNGIVPPPPPPQAAQGLDLTRFLEGMAQFVAQHRDAPVPQGGTGKVLREFLQFQPPQFLGQPDPDIARAWLDAVERTFHSMECVPEERVLLASYQLQAQALTWWSSEWETTFQSRPLRQISWLEFVVSFERALCPTYVRTERLYQFLDLQQRDSTVVQYRARFVELGRYALLIMADESLRTQGLRPELKQALIVARVIDLDAAYQTAAALEADTLRTRARSAEVQTQVVSTQPRQQQGSVQTTQRTTTSYASTSAGTTTKSGSRRKFRRDRKQAEQRQQSVGSVQQPVGRRRLPFQASLATPVLVRPSCSTTAITAADKQSLSLNFKAKNILCCALSKKEFNRVSACKSAKEIWDNLQITYEGTDKVKQTRIDILVSQYEQFKMLQNENINTIYNRFSSIVVAAPSTSSSSSSKDVDFEDSDVDDVLSKLQKILKKKKNGSRRFQKKERKEKEPVCYECRKPRHLRPDCPRLKKTGQPKKSKIKHKKFKRKAMAATWKNEETTYSESSSSESEKEQ
ncbi:hypothetical protein Taro_044573, partial [Colocasia esculenta]|nr:hypothetical protein [Colocasia esculenta]